MDIKENLPCLLEVLLVPNVVVFVNVNGDEEVSEVEDEFPLGSLVIGRSSDASSFTMFLFDETFEIKVHSLHNQAF